LSLDIDHHHQQHQPKPQQHSNQPPCLSRQAVVLRPRAAPSPSPADHRVFHSPLWDPTTTRHRLPASPSTRQRCAAQAASAQALMSATMIFWAPTTYHSCVTLPHRHAQLRCGSHALCCLRSPTPRPAATTARCPSRSSLEDPPNLVVFTAIFQTTSHIHRTI
jgi:hypothetical protein